MSSSRRSRQRYDARGFGQAAWRRTQNALREGSVRECALPWSGGADSRRARAQIPRTPRSRHPSGSPCACEKGF